MDFFTSIWSAIVQSFAQLLESAKLFFPSLIAAIVVLIIGLLVAKALGNLVKRLVELLKVDNLIAKIDIIEHLNKTGSKVSLSAIIGWMVYWFLVIATLIAVADILKLESFTQFLNSIAMYLPNVVIAVLILMAGLVLGGGVQDLIIRVVRSANLQIGGIVGTVAKWAIVIFAIMAALIQLEIASSLISTLFTGIVFMLALAGGLAFGLGGKESAARMLEDLRTKIKS